ncbi:2-succinyl-5-enolpyruvyl-6-hydroxy-3-cyclohexene-1-carboxylate synthase [Pontibacillus chungwhensis BH030062]|uniref:2-succinyl-5-enolpyruvyl-6-hydroxy-3-cyclohexene-1-carboxylate synthase n=1 Tax=Pontibacillus chungwhensis BH030062 TaxID=1385513 RepID=A0A0A2UYV6_9BACI|nr:2-succinyl-5-enolpyruvyl-6-hydroxy-3-cyclohexene-1-carboxylic-acid synthase [Pontibacillus chungwhensis]KGP91716.1 2-succinyl-5-enolpyruvyl-6-hydroxy-3-cyclohexene-1-carboxylate synthase [Pontibacillus chungwhensis BH030062]
MTHTETLTRYVANFVDELVQTGLTDVVLSPGSRSTPLSMTFAEHEAVNHWIHVDERSAAFFALGMAKEQQKPVAIVCTSGTAAANYYPAIVEAYYSRVPLLVLTADRPHELRDVGAPQAIDQIHMFGQYVKWFEEMALPESSEEMLRYVRSKAARAFYTSLDHNPGPVHLNFPFRSPLIPDFSLDHLWGGSSEQSFHHAYHGERTVQPEVIEEIKSRVDKHQKGLIVCGPQTDQDLPVAVTQLARYLQLPVLADPLSQVRSGQHEKDHVIESYDAILKSPTVREQFVPDFIIRFGAMPISKPYWLMLQDHPEIEQYVVESYEGFREPSGNAASLIFADGKHFCDTWVNHFESSFFDVEWLKKWQEANQLAKATLIENEGTTLSEGHVFSEILKSFPEEGSLFVGNSMPIRDLDTFMLTTPKSIRTLANRGANGIDGVVSSAFGAAAHGEKVTLVLGDLSFFHDLNGLFAAKQFGLDLRIVVINNEGGGIFSFLPQAEHKKHFEPLFGTPLALDYSKVIEMYGGQYEEVGTWEQLRNSLSRSYEARGLSVIEVKTNREENAAWHRQKWKQIERALLER